MSFNLVINIAHTISILINWVCTGIISEIGEELRGWVWNSIKMNAIFLVVMMSERTEKTDITRVDFQYVHRRIR